MNTKKARGKRVPLGRCLNSTELVPDTQQDTVKILEKDETSKFRFDHGNKLSFNVYSIKIFPKNILYSLLRSKYFEKYSTIQG